MKWPLVGRDRELRSLRELIAGGGRGAIVVGAAGVGKTRLAGELARIAVEQGLVVEWVRATRSAASFALGAFAPLLPPGLGERGELLARAHGTLGQRAAGSRLALCVDDGHLLDDASAALVHQLAIAGEAFITVTVRRDANAPDALTALWKDELCTLIELEPLHPPDVETLLATALGGHASAPTSRQGSRRPPSARRR